MQTCFQGLTPAGNTPSRTSGRKPFCKTTALCIYAQWPSDGPCKTAGSMGTESWWCVGIIEEYFLVQHCTWYKNINVNEDLQLFQSFLSAFWNHFFSANHHEVSHWAACDGTHTEAKSLGAHMNMKWTSLWKHVICNIDQAFVWNVVYSILLITWGRWQVH